jgi:hypothetical protein
MGGQFSLSDSHEEALCGTADLVRGGVLEDLLEAFSASFFRL